MGHYFLERRYLSVQPYILIDKKAGPGLYTVCPKSSDPFYMISYYIKWVTTSWTYSMRHHVGNVKSLSLHRHE